MDVDHQKEEEYKKEIKLKKLQHKIQKYEIFHNHSGYEYNAKCVLVFIKKGEKNGKI